MAKKSKKSENSDSETESSGVVAKRERIALTVKVDGHTYERAMILKARTRQPLQDILEDALKARLNQEGL
jgi:hypothetical protein